MADLAFVALRRRLRRLRHRRRDGDLGGLFGRPLRARCRRRQRRRRGGSGRRRGHGRRRRRCLGHRRRGHRVIGKDHGQLARREREQPRALAVVALADVEAHVADAGRHRELADDRGHVDRPGERRVVAAVRAELRDPAAGLGVGDVGPAVAGVGVNLDHDRLGTDALRLPAAELEAGRAHPHRCRLRQLEFHHRHVVGADAGLGAAGPLPEADAQRRPEARAGAGCDELPGALQRGRHGDRPVAAEGRRRGQGQPEQEPWVALHPRLLDPGGFAERGQGRPAALLRSYRGISARDSGRRRRARPD